MIDTKRRLYILCPYCGSENKEGALFEGVSGKQRCADCNKVFVTSVTIEKRYSTYKEDRLKF